MYSFLNQTNWLLWQQDVVLIFLVFTVQAKAYKNYAVATKLISVLSHLVTVGIFSNWSSCHALRINSEIMTGAN